jgi:Flp pilus assembly protein TadB
MLKKVLLALGVLVFLSGCTVWQSRSDTIQESERKTVTKTTEVQEVLTETGIQLLTKEVYTEEISEEVATAEQKRSHSSPMVENSLKKAGSFLGIPPDIIAMIIAAAGGVGAIKGYDKVRDAEPRKPKIEAQV